MFRFGLAVKARQGEAWFGMARHGSARHGSRGKAEQGEAMQGAAGHGKAVKVMRVMSRLSGDWQGSQGASLRVRLVSVWRVSSRSGLPAMVRSVEHCRVQ